MLELKRFRKKYSILYIAKDIQEKADKIINVKPLKDVLIAIADCTLFPDKSEYKSRHTIRNKRISMNMIRRIFILHL